MRRDTVEEQDLGWQPVRYPYFSDIDTGEYRLVIDNEEPVAVVWTNWDASTGVMWLQQTELVMGINKLFLHGAASGMPAVQAYGAVLDGYGSSLGPAQSGSLTQVNDVLRDIMNES